MKDFEDQTKKPTEFTTSSLPSRKEVHGNKKQKMNFKIKIPLIKLLTMSFILLVISTFAIYTYLTKDSEEAVKDSGTSNEMQENAEEENPVIIELADESESEEEDKEAADDRNSETETEKTEAEEVSDKGQMENSQDSSAAADQPASDEKTNTRPPAENNEKPSESSEGDYTIVEHIVKPKETVFRISMTYYSSQEGIELIRKWNNLSGNEIRTGQVLKIPLKK